MQRRTQALTGRLTQAGRHLKWTNETRRHLGLAQSVRFWWVNRPRQEPRVLKITWPTLLHPVELRSTLEELRTFRDVMIEESYASPYGSTPITIFDIGANIGLASVWYASRFPQAMILAVEPEPVNYALLEVNCRPYANIRTVCGAVWSHDCLVEIGNTHGSRSDSYRAIGLSNSPDQDDSPVRALTVDSLMALAGLEKVDLLKMDIEGAEIEVFQTSASWLDRVSEIVLELHDRHRSGCDLAFSVATEHLFDDRVQQGENTFVRRRQVP